MAIKVKEVIMYIYKGLLFSIKTSYRTACAHPLILGVVFLLLILYRMFPSLFAILVTSSPVIVCTAVLLGTLLSYGAPNTPKIEEENRKTEKISSPQVGSAVGGLVTKKDESFTVETHVKTSTVVDERTVKEAVLGQASISACNEVAREVPSTAMHDVGNHKDDSLLPASSADEDTKETNIDKRLPEEREVCDHRLFMNEEFPVEQQSEGALRLGEDVGDVSLAVQISKPELDNLYDSSLGSPWQPIDSHDTSSGSESNSSGSSSPDASLADIIPMLDELHPLSDFEHPQATMRSAGYLDSASSGSSSDGESNDWNAEEKIESKEDRGKVAVQEEQHGGNEDTVTWNSDEQKNVMDLGISEVERNRRLESLIAKRRARKLMRFETEKNLLDINRYYPTPIPPISVPRRNPFDFSYDSVPGSAPPTLQPREDPFDLHYDLVGKNSSYSREYLRHHDFVSPPERDMFPGTHESYSLGPSFSVDLHEEEDGSKLKLYYVTERMGSQKTEFIAFQRQLSEESDFNLSSVSESNKVSSVTGLEDHTEVLPQPQVRQESNFLHLANLDAEHVEQDSNSITELDSVNVRNEEIKEDFGDDPANNLNTSIVVEETGQPTDSSSAMEEEIGEAAANLPISDAEKLDVIEARYASDSSTSEENEKSSGMDIHKESANMEKTRNDTLQSDRDIDMPAAHPVYDSYPSSVANSLSNTSLLDEVLLYEGKENSISSFLLSDVQADFSELVPTSEPLQLDSSFEDRDYVEVNESVGDELAYDIGGPSKASSSSASSLDEIESSSTEITETKEHDAIRVEVSKTTEDVPELAAGEIMPISSFSSIDSEAGEVSTVHVDKGTQPRGDHVMDVPPSKEESVIDPSCESGVEESQVSILDLPSVPEENVADFKFEEHENTTEPTAICGITGLQVIEDPDLHLYDAKEQSSSDPKVTGSISNNDHTNELVPMEENIDALVTSSIIPPHDGGATGVPILGSTKSTEFSTLSKATSELEMESNDDLSHSEGNITAVQKEGSYLENLNNLNEEPDDDVHAGETEIKESDERLLSGLDAVGDFQVDRDLKLDQGGSDVESQLKTQFNSLDVSSAAMRQASEVRPMDGTVTLLGTHSEDTLTASKEVKLGMDQPAFPTIEVESSVEPPSHEDPELTVHNPKLHVIEACSPLEELDSVFRQHHEKAAEPSSSSSLTLASSGTSNSGVGASELVISDRDPELKETYPHFQVPEEKSLEGDLHKPGSSEFEPSDGKVLPDGSNVEFLEAKSLEGTGIGFQTAL